MSFQGFIESFLRRWILEPRFMKIEVEFSPAFQSRLSLERQILTLEEGRSTVQDLLERLAQEHGGKIRPLLFGPKENEILSGLVVMINDRTFTGNALNQKKIRLGEGDRVNLLYFMSGG
jgi:sulfur carrier protein ThiS